MKKEHLILMTILVLCFIGCYPAIRGRVIDAETAKPIEGAIVLVEWTKTVGLPGLKHNESYKVLEAVSDKDGAVNIEGCYSLSVNSPRMTVYKKGYVAWNNEFIFPSREKRKDFEWSNGFEIRVKPYSDIYIRKDHVYFFHRITHWGRLINDSFRCEEIEMEKAK